MYRIYQDGDNYHVIEKVDSVGYFLTLNYFSTPCPVGKYRTVLEAHRNLKRLRPHSCALALDWCPEMGLPREMRLQ